MLLVVAASSGAAPTPSARVPAAYEQWRRDAEFLFTSPDRERWDELAGDLEREVFIERFWEPRGVEARRRFAQRRRSAAQARLRSAAQTEVLLVAGTPAQVEDLPACDRVLRRLQIWRWTHPQEMHAVFVQSANFDPRSFRIWSAREDGAEQLVFGSTQDPVRSIVEAARGRGCIGAQRAAELERQLRSGLSKSELVRASNWPEGPEGPEGPEESEGPQGSESLGRSLPIGGGAVGAEWGVGRLELSLEGSSFRRTVVRGRIALPTGELASLDGRSLFERVTVHGDLRRGGRLHESFEVVHHLAGAPPSSGEVTVDFWRRLVPGDYRLELRVTDGLDRTLLRSSRDLEVTKLEQEATAPPGRRGGLAQVTRDELVVLTTLPRVRLQTRFADRVGRRRVARALVSGGPIGSVEFLFGGRTVATLEAEPFETTVELPGEIPPSGVPLEVRALDPEGGVLDSDRTLLRPRDLPFRVRFLEPSPGPQSPVAGSSRGQLPFELSLPAEVELASVTCYLNRQVVDGGPADAVASADLSQGACEVPDVLPVGLVFARVVATLEDGEETEDLLFLSGQSPDEIEVRMEEVLVSVVDAAGSPQSVLDAASVELLVGGEARAVERVTPVSSLPLSAALMIDTSSSMGRRTRAASAAAARWFEELIEPGDRAALITFGEDLDLRVPWTDDAAELGRRASGIRAHGTTRLYDSVVYGIAAFENQSRRRALIVLTDGADTDSDHRLNQVLRAARRSGTAVFPVALSDFDQEALSELGDLAQKSGGTLHHAIGEGAVVAALDRIARQLRTEHRLSFRAAADRPALRLDEVEVRVGDPALRVRSVRAAGGAGRR